MSDAVYGSVAINAFTLLDEVGAVFMADRCSRGRDRAARRPRVFARLGAGPSL
jgi:hypothetical protein